MSKPEQSPPLLIHSAACGKNGSSLLIRTGNDAEVDVFGLGWPRSSCPALTVPTVRQARALRCGIGRSPGTRRVLAGRRSRGQPTAALTLRTEATGTRVPAWVATRTAAVVVGKY